MSTTMLQHPVALVTTVLLLLPCGKTDHMALGTVRLWRCLCAAGFPYPCTCHELVAHVEFLRTFSGSQFAQGLLFPNALGLVVEKEWAVRIIEYLASRVRPAVA